MDDEENIDEILESVLTSDDAPGISDRVADSLLAIPVRSKRKAAESVHAALAKRVLREYHPDPIRVVAGPISFGGWLEKTRTGAGLGPKSVAAALGLDPTFVTRVENDSVMPLDMDAAGAADWLVLFRLHCDALPRLLRTTYGLDRPRAGRASRNGARPERGHRGPEDFGYAAFTGLSGPFDSASEGSAEPTSQAEIDDWLARLKGELAKRPDGADLL